MAKETTRELAVTAGPATEELKRDLMAVGTVDGDPTDRMIAFIAAAPPEDWDTLWQSVPSTKNNVGQTVRVHAIRVAPSDHEGPLGVYLIADVDWLATGERGLLSAGGDMCIAQLVTLHKKGYFPCDLEIVEKKEPTKAGFKPIHFRYLGKAVAAAAAGE